MPSVSRDEFEVRSELEAVHLPTGAVFSAYPYSDPDDMLHSIKEQWVRAGSPASTGDYAEQVRLVASQLLLERARHAVRAGRYALPLEKQFTDTRQNAV